MSCPKGYPSQEKEDRLRAEFVTVSPVGQSRHALETRKRDVHEFGTDAAEAGSTTSQIAATAHGALKGDVIRFTSGALATLEFDVVATDTNTIDVAPSMDSAPGVGDAFAILRATSLTLTSTGGFASVNTFVRDGSNQVVTEDTVTPANNRPLPVKLTDFSGDMVLNATNLGLEVQLSHTGAVPDSVQIGDGTEVAAINASSELTVEDAAARTSLASIDTDTTTIAGDTTSIDGKTPALGAAVIAASTPVNIASDQTVPISAASLPLPTGAATEATLSSIDTDTSTIAGDTTSLDAKLPAQGAAVTAASTPVNIASDQTVPVSAASLPLPTGAATEATLSSIDTDTSTIAGDTTSLDAKLPAQGAAVTAASTPVNIASDQTVPVSAASLPLPSGAATEATLATIDADTSTLAGAVAGTEMQVDVVASLPAGSNNIGDVDIASALPTGTNTIGNVNVNWLDVVDFFDTPLLDTSVSNIPGSAGSPLQVIASTAAAVSKIQVFDTTGEFFGIYTGAAASEVLVAVVGPGSDQTVEVSIPASTRISLLSLTTSAISVGDISMNFMG